MTYRAIFDAKIQGVARPLVFDFTGQLGPGETISSATVTAIVHSGADSSPSAFLSGSPEIAGEKITQDLADGVLGVTYELLCVANIRAGYSIVQTGFVVVAQAFEGLLQ